MSKALGAMGKSRTLKRVRSDWRGFVFMGLVCTDMRVTLLYTLGTSETAHSRRVMLRQWPETLKCTDAASF